MQHLTNDLLILTCLALKITFSEVTNHACTLSEKQKDRNHTDSYRGVFRTLSNIYDGGFYQNS